MGGVLKNFAERPSINYCHTTLLYHPIHLVSHITCPVIFMSCTNLSYSIGGLGLSHFSDEDRIRAVQGFLMDPESFEKVTNSRIPVKEMKRKKG